MTGGVGGSMGGASGSGHVLPVPSAGCSKMTGRPAGGVVTAADSHYYMFPSTYDGTKAFPALVGFHGCGSGNRGTTKDDTEWVSYTKGSGFETDYVRVIPLSTDTGGCWNYGTNIPKVTQMYDDLLANYCVDTSRVFATGHSSGAQFVVQILTHATDARHLQLKAVAPVSASDYGVITGPIPVMYIQGMMDQERGGGDGHETVARFTAANGCGSRSMPYTKVAMCQSQGGATTVNPGCKIYDGCMVPTIWCSHNDPFYSGTMHGIPCFGVKAMHDFFESLI